MENLFDEKVATEVQKPIMYVRVRKKALHQIPAYHVKYIMRTKYVGELKKGATIQWIFSHAVCVNNQCFGPFFAKSNVVPRKKDCLLSIHVFV